MFCEFAICHKIVVCSKIVSRLFVNLAPILLTATPNTAHSAQQVTTFYGNTVIHPLPGHFSYIFVIDEAWIHDAVTN